MTYTAGEAAAPVTDWVHDWDWLDDQWGPNAIAIWRSVREQCEMASTERYGRAFMPVTMEAVTQIAHDTEHFSSVWVSVARPDAVVPGVEAAIDADEQLTSAQKHALLEMYRTLIGKGA